MLTQPTSPVLFMPVRRTLKPVFPRKPVQDLYYSKEFSAEISRKMLIDTIADMAERIDCNVTVTTEVNASGIHLVFASKEFQLSVIYTDNTGGH